ncbi:LAMI_0G09604g1_1 [Lachancea mirantina]|uniref:LAMI_0G09604g1_1 n=1 Tax=Lachancea mirantina TaxID=1230905 RepID=A0A1G4KAF2_9SACH|nr:LAMI_0G09604g1_1 [Lachancea mirantina]
MEQDILNTTSVSKSEDVPSETAPKVSDTNKKGNGDATASVATRYQSPGERSHRATSKTARGSRSPGSHPNHLNPAVAPTSRYMGALDSHSSSATAQHANPHIYFQHKTRPNAPFNSRLITGRKLIYDSQSVETHDRTASGLDYSLQTGSIPVFQFSRADLPEFHDFYGQAEEVGRQFGAVKVVILDDADNKTDNRATGEIEPFLLNTEYFWFRARRQALDSSSKVRQNRLNFYRNLFYFHKNTETDEAGGDHLLQGKIPSIEKRPLDFYRLRQCVRLRGGFDVVCQKKLWAQIGRELGYSGRIMSSLSTSLRAAYAKVILTFDSHEKNFCPKDKFCNFLEEAQIMQKPPILLSSVSPNPQNPLKRPNDVSVLFSESEHEVTKKKQRRSFSLPEIHGSSHEYIRLRDLKAVKGFDTNFDSLTEPRKNQSVSPNGDITTWKIGTELYDTSCHESADAPIYNLRQYHEKSQRFYEFIQRNYGDNHEEFFQNSDATHVSDFEKLYFRLLADKAADFEVDSGVGLSSEIHGSAFQSTLKNGISSSSPSQSWNVNELPFCEKSLLRFVDIDYGNHSNSKLDVGMLFSTKGWSVEDNFMPCLDYNHVGSSRLWHIIPGNDLQKFEGLIDRLNSERYTEPEIKSDPAFECSQFFQAYVDTNPLNETRTSLPRKSLHLWPPNAKSTKGKAYIDNVKSKTLPDNIQLSPYYLRSQGVTVHTVTQEVGSYILKYPRAYSSTKAVGFHVSESARFAPSSWLLNDAFDGESWLTDRGILPGLNTARLAFEIVHRSHDGELVSKCVKMIEQRVQLELRQREEFKQIFTDSASLFLNNFDFISDLDVSLTGFSKVMISNALDSFTLSLSQFLMSLRKQNGSIYLYGQDLNGDDIRISLHVMYSDASLAELLIQNTTCEQLITRLKSAIDQEPNFSFDAFIKNNYTDQPVPLADIETALAKLSIVRDSSNLSVICEYMTTVYAMERKCAILLTEVREDARCYDDVSLGSGLDLHSLPPSQCRHSVSDFVLLSEKLKRLSIEVPAYRSIQQYMTRILEFQNRCASVLKLRNYEDLKGTYIEGWKLGIRMKCHEYVARELCQIHWLDAYEFVVGSPRYDAGKFNNSNDYQVRFLPKFLEFGLKCLDSTHVDKIKFVRRIILETQDVVSRVAQILRKKKAWISVKEIEYISKRAELQEIPVSAQFVDILKNILDSVTKAKAEMAPVLSRLGKDESSISSFCQLMSSGSLEALDLLPQFNGSVTDRRLGIEEVPNGPFFSTFVKEGKDWMQKLSSLVSRRNYLAKISESTFECLDLREDVYRADWASRVDRAYCFCRRGDYGGTMVECEICREWYHVSCINKGKGSPPIDVNNVFVCAICVPEPATCFEVADPRLNFNSLVTLAMTSCQLTLIPDRGVLADLFQCLEAALRFKDHIRNAVIKVDEGQLQRNFTIDELKFCLRKLVGSACQLTDEITIFKMACQEYNENEYKNLQQRGVVVITGDETTNCKQEPSNVLRTSLDAQSDAQEDNGTNDV